jgi:hypothetical protein
MNNRIVLVPTGILLILGFAITSSNNLFWSIYQQVVAQPQPSQQQPTSAGAALTYADPICAIRIQYPPNWEATGLGSGGAQFSVPRINDSFSISISPFSSSSLGSAPSLESHARDAIDSLRKDLGQNFQLINSGKATVAGNPAVSIEYRFRDVGGFGLGPAVSEQQAEVKRTLDIFTTKGDKLYTLSYSAPDAEYPRYLPTINSMISTFAIGNPSSACRPENAFLSLGGGFGGGLSVDPFGGELDESIGGSLLPGPQLGATAPGNNLGGDPSGGFVPATPRGGEAGTAPGGTGGNLPAQPQQQPPSAEQPQGIPTQE